MRLPACFETELKSAPEGNDFLLRFVGKLHCVFFVLEPVVLVSELKRKTQRSRGALGFKTRRNWRQLMSYERSKNNTAEEMYSHFSELSFNVRRLMIMECFLK